MNYNLCLPPMVDDICQGSLDFIIMQPSLNYKLPSMSNLSITISWWGSNLPTTIRLKSNEKIGRISYDVCCDWKTFRKYLFNLNQIKCVIKYEGSSSNENSQNSPKIRVGEILGKFFLRNINLNSIDTYIQDCSIVNTTNVICGSTTVLLYYTSEKKKFGGKNIFISKFISPASSMPKDGQKPLYNCSKSDSSVNLISQDLHKTQFRENATDISKEESNSDICYDDEIHMMGLLSLVERGDVDKSHLPLLMKIMKDKLLDKPKKLVSDSVLISNKMKHPIQMCNNLKKPHENADNPEGMTSMTDCDKENIDGTKSQSSIESEVDEDNPLICLYIDSIILNVLEDMDHFQQESPHGDKKCIVKQRSKMCYIIKVSLVTEDETITFPETYISRQIKLGVVTFNCKKFFRLPKNVRKNSTHYIRFSVRSRKLSERMGNELGTGQFPLIRALNWNDFPCHFFPQNGSSASLQPTGLIKTSVLLMNCSTNPDDWEDVPDECTQDLVNLAPAVKTFEQFELQVDQSKPVILQQNKSPVETNDMGRFVPQEVQYRGKNDIDKQLFSRPQVNDLSVRIELIEGSSMAVRRVGNSQNFFYPNTYVVLNASETLKTPVCTVSSHPKWDFAGVCCIKQTYLIQTNDHIVLKVYHCLKGRTYDSSDPLLGFVSISLLPLLYGPISGWFPVLNLEGNIYGKIKVIITLNETDVRHILQKKNQSPYRYLKITKENNNEAFHPKSNDNIANPHNQLRETCGDSPKHLQVSHANLERFMWKNQLDNERYSVASYTDNFEFSALSVYNQPSTIPCHVENPQSTTQKTSVKKPLSQQQVTSFEDSQSLQQNSSLEDSQFLQQNLPAEDSECVKKDVQPEFLPLPSADIFPKRRKHRKVRMKAGLVFHSS